MKKTTVFVALIAGIAFNTVVLASGFNERGEDFIASVQPGSDASAQSVTVSSQGFNQRGVNFIAEAPAGSSAADSEVHLTSTGFNDRSFESIN